MKQNEKGLMQWEKDFLISVTILIIATIIAHIFFYQTAHNINVPMIYTLATFFISRYTKGYVGRRLPCARFTAWCMEGPWREQLFRLGRAHRFLPFPVGASARIVRGYTARFFTQWNTM